MNHRVMKIKRTSPRKVFFDKLTLSKDPNSLILHQKLVTKHGQDIQNKNQKQKSQKSRTGITLGCTIYQRHTATRTKAHQLVTNENIGVQIHLDSSFSSFSREIQCH